MTLQSSHPLTLREEVAAYLHQRMQPGFSRWDDLGQHSRRAWLQDADRIIGIFVDRLHEPNKTMLDALAREKKLLGSKLTIAQAWQAMLHAGLEGVKR